MPDRGYLNAQLLSCSCKKLKCGNRLSKNWQRQLHSSFWNLERFNIRKQWILNHAVGLKSKHLSAQKNNVSNRKWFMSDWTGKIVQVCREFFLKTLAYKWDLVLYLMLPCKNVCLNHSFPQDPGSKTEDNLQRIIFLHIKSYLKKYHSSLKKSKGSLKRMYDFNLVKRSFHSFKSTHPFPEASYRIFRKIFCTVFAAFSVDESYLSIMPNTVLLNQAYQKCDLSYIRHKDPFLDIIKSPEEIQVKALSPSKTKGISHTVRKANGMSMKQEQEVQNIIMQLDIDNDAIVITQNSSDSDTEHEDEMATKKVNIRVRKRASCNQKDYKSTRLQMEHVTDKYPVLPPCTCRRRCFTRLSENRRKEICASFWDLGDYSEQKQWIEKHIHRSVLQRRIRGRKRETRSYFLTDETDQSVSVCAVYFQRTLGFTDGSWLEFLWGCTSRDVRLSSSDHIDQREQVNEMNVKVQRYLERYINRRIALGDNLYKNTDGTKPGTSSRGWSVKNLHNDFLANHPLFPVSYERFKIIYHEVSNTCLLHSGISDCKNVRSDASGSIRHSSRNRNVKSVKSSLADGEGGGSAVPERRRSIRTTRMQGSMAEDNLLELAFESSMGSTIVSTHKNLHIKQKNDPDCKALKLKLRPRYSAKRISRMSEKLTRSEHAVSQEQNVNVQGNNQKIKQQFPTSDQSVVKSKLNSQNSVQTRQRKHLKERRHAFSKFRRRKKKGNLKEIDDSQLNNHRNNAETAHNSRRHCKLSSLKKKHKHPILPPCNCSRRKCIENIPEEIRREIHEHFWNFNNYRDRKRWLMKYVEKRERKVKVLSLFPQRKNESKKYFLPDEKGQTVEVCRLFFIHTLGFRWDSVVDAIVRTKIPSHVAVEQNHQFKKPPRQLPEYIVDSVKQYLKSIQNSHNITEDSEMVIGDQEEAYSEGQVEDRLGLKVKDLFKGWKVRYKSLKFNLGYHSFRRIFQSVVDPVVDACDSVVDTTGSAPVKDHGSHTSDVDSGLDDDIDDQEPALLPETETSYTSIDFQSHQSAQTANCSETKLCESELSTCLNEKAGTEFTNNSTVSSSTVSENMAENSRSIPQDNEGSVLKHNDSDCNEQSTTSVAEHTDDCILDVGSGYFKQLGSIVDSDRHYPYNYEYRCKKRRSLSTRNDKNNYPVLPACKCRKRKCAEKFTEAQRQKINDMFWNLGGYNERKQWILEHIKRADIKRRVVFSEGTPRKLESRWYYLPDDDGNKIDVCKAFFLRTLGYRWDSVIDTIGKTTPKGEKWAAPDKRGRKPPPHKISDEAVSSMTLYIENVCQTYQPVCQQTNQNQKKGSRNITGSMIPYGLTMKQLFEDYKSKHPNHKFGYESFRKIFRRVHGAFLASLPPDLESNEEPEPAYCEKVDSVDKDYSESANVECSGSFQPQGSNFVPTTESYSDISHYTPPPPPPTPPPPSNHQVSHEQLIGSSAPERRSCLYQYGNQTCESQQLQPLPVMQVPDIGGPLPQARYNSADHDPFMKYSHNLYCPPTGMPGHFSQMTDHLGYTSSMNPRTDMESATCGGQSQFAPYFVSSPEPLRHQVYQMASQYQSILHHIAESSRFFNYGGYPPPDPTFQGGHEKHYPYMKQQDFHRDNFTSYNVPKTSHGYVNESSPMPTQYPPLSHVPHNNMQQGHATTILSPHSDENENSFAHVHDEGPNVTKGQDMNNSFDSDLPSGEKDRKSASKGRTSSKKFKMDRPKIKKEKKIRPKSVRNYGDHYPMLSACHCKKKKCTDKFSESDRQRIHNMFWDLKDYNERKQWMLLHIKRDECKRRRIDQFESFRKQESRWYFFPDEDGNQHEVCKDFFLRTLGYKWDSVIDTIRRTTPKGETNTRPDQRGRKAPAHKLSSVVLRSVVQYIESMQQVSQPLTASCADGSGQLRKVDNPGSDQSSKDSSSNSAVQIAVPYGLTMKDLYDDYKAKHSSHKIGYESFRRIFRALSKSEKIVLDDRSADDDILNSDNQDFVDF